MRRLFAIAILIFISPFPSAGQSSKEEAEFRAFLAEYDKAVVTRDIGFLERVIPEDFVFTGASGKLSVRAQVLAFFTKERDKPSHRFNSLKHENVSVHVANNMAVVTNDYTSETTPIESPNAEPAITKGRHTGVFEKRRGRWMVIAEQDTEQPNDDKVPMRQVTAAGRAYNELLARLTNGRSYTELAASGDIAMLKLQLADDYIATNAEGKILTKVDELESYKATSGRRTESATLLEQHVLAVDNNTAVETGKVKSVETTAGVRSESITQYTTTWVSWGAGWQIIARHASRIQNQK
jgi:ketosteroid isomerase-like protein